MSVVKNTRISSQAYFKTPIFSGVSVLDPFDLSRDEFVFDGLGDSIVDVPDPPAGVFSFGSPQGSEDLVEYLSLDADSTPSFEFEIPEEDRKGLECPSLFSNDIPVSVDEYTSSSGGDSTLSFLPTPAVSAETFFTFENVCKKRRREEEEEELDHLGVVKYNRKQRLAPLTPVIPESDDPIALKRARNTEAARRSRARKLQRMSQLEDRVEELLARNSELEMEIISLKSLLNKQINKQDR